MPAGVYPALVAGLGFASEGGLEVLFGLGSGVLVCHIVSFCELCLFVLLM